MEYLPCRKFPAFTTGINRLDNTCPNPGTNIRYDRLYCVLKNQPHMAYQSLYLSIFLSFQQFFHLISSVSISATVFIFCIHNEDNQVLYCKQNQMLRFIFAFFFYFPFFYLSLQCFLSKISQELLDLEF